MFLSLSSQEQLLCLDAGTSQPACTLACYCRCWNPRLSMQSLATLPMSPASQRGSGTPPAKRQHARNCCDRPPSVASAFRPTLASLARARLPRLRARLSQAIPRHTWRSLWSKAIHPRKHRADALLLLSLASLYSCQARLEVFFRPGVVGLPPRQVPKGEQRPCPDAIQEQFLHRTNSSSQRRPALKWPLNTPGPHRAPPIRSSPIP